MNSYGQFAKNNPYRPSREAQDRRGTPSPPFPRSEAVAVVSNTLLWHIAVVIGLLNDWPRFCIGLAVTSFTAGLFLIGTTLNRCCITKYPPTYVGLWLFALVSSLLMVFESPVAFRAVAGLFVGCAVVTSIALQLCLLIVGRFGRKKKS